MVAAHSKTSTRRSGLRSNPAPPSSGSAQLRRCSTGSGRHRPMPARVPGVTTEIAAEVRKLRAENGARKVWFEMRREGIDVARCTVDGCPQARRRTSRQEETDHHRRSARPSCGGSGAAKVQPACAKHVAGSRLYIMGQSVWVYVAFVIDAYSRRILRWTLLRQYFIFRRAQSSPFTGLRISNALHKNSTGGFEG